MTLSRLRSSGTVLTLTALIGFAVSLIGCASAGPVTPVGVSDVKTVAGTWKGMVYQSGVAPDYVTLTIKEDGSYEVKSVQAIGTSRGNGKIVVSEGRLLFEGVKGRGVGILQRSPAGDLVMTVDATLSDDSTLSAKLWPSQ
jgi:hypothetical protein